MNQINAIEGKERILILVPETSARGGVTTYFQVIKNEFSFPVDYLVRGNRNYPNRSNFIFELVRMILDSFRFLYRLIFFKYDLVQTNTSFYLNSVIRDAITITLAKVFRKKVIVFYHGWDEELENRVDKNKYKFFRYIYFKADASMVLSQRFKKKLEEWGYKKPIYIETTIVDKQLLKGIDKDSIIKKFSHPNEFLNILFLARVERTKGIYEALDAYKIAKLDFSNIIFTVVGDGTELDNVKNYVKEKLIPDVKFKGFQANEGISLAFKEADIYLFPSYTEGMPTSVLEAMSFGIPIVTRPVGGLRDLFIDEEMGFSTESLDPNDFAQILKRLIQDLDLRKRISLYNYEYAAENFISDVVVRRVEKIISNTIKQKN